MIDKLVNSYLKSLSTTDIILFAKKNNIDLDNNESKIIYNYIINNWYTLIHEDTTILFDKFQKEVSTDTYNKCIKLYNEYKEKYKHYL